MTELAIGTVLFAGLVWWWVVLEYRAYRRRVALQLMLTQIAVEMHRFAVTVGLAFSPAIRQAIEAMRDFQSALDQLREVLDD